MHEASFYKKLENQQLNCHLCPHYCKIKDGKRGICRVRKNVNGELDAETYGVVSALNFDPIEKKPLYHYYPGSTILSVGSYGCNLSCKFCQNFEISQSCVPDYVESRKYKPQTVVDNATAKKNNLGLAYTYNEPIVWFEYMYDMARQAKDKGLKNVIVTNGFITEEPLHQLLTVMDAFAVDLKAFHEDFYKKQTGSSLKPVLETLKTLAKENKHIEITNLIIPTLNDDAQEFEELVKWIKNEVGENTVLHISRYFPVYKLNIRSTPVDTLLKLDEIARQHLNYVFPGNMHTSKGESNTYCPDCGHELIERSGYYTNLTGINENKQCSNCKSPVKGIVLK
ncbi:MAG: AmmeMemoRadiSam system radical SAM enzyme [Bacteroidales bacterium]|nr:AmmeMemoRadiSam system radical SAM enzyme [Bacteroidales bacterium]